MLPKYLFSGSIYALYAARLTHGDVSIIDRQYFGALQFRLLST